jgi:hypothetical protein
MINGVIEILVENAGVQTAIGLDKDALRYKVFPVLCPPTEVVPYMICALSGSTPTLSKELASDLDLESFEIFIFTQTYEQGHNIDLAIRAALDNARGTTDTTLVHFDKIWFTSRRDAQVQGREGIYTRVVSYACHVKNNPIVT